MAEQLIELVKNEPMLYVSSHPDYSKKSLKDVIWARIAEESDYKDGPAAKDVWFKLRNCHRDAIRRRDRWYKNGLNMSACKSWKYEKQMQFLLPYMSNPGSNLEELAAPEYLNLEYDIGPENNDETIPSPDAITIKQTGHVVEGSRTPNEGTGIGRGDPLKPNDLKMLYSAVGQNHEDRIEQRAGKRSADRDHEADDELRQFLNTMYAIVKKMPPSSQIKLRRTIFNIVSDEEESLLQSTSPPIFIQVSSPECSPSNTPVARRTSQH